MQGNVTKRPFAHCAKSVPTHAFSPDVQGEFAFRVANFWLKRFRVDCKFGQCFLNTRQGRDRDTHFRFLASIPFWRVNPARGTLTGVAETVAAKAMATTAANFMVRP